MAWTVMPGHTQHPSDRVHIPTAAAPSSRLCNPWLQCQLTFVCQAGADILVVGGTWASVSGMQQTPFSRKVSCRCSSHSSRANQLVTQAVTSPWCPFPQPVHGGLAGGVYLSRWCQSPTPHTSPHPTTLPASKQPSESTCTACLTHRPTL